MRHVHPALLLRLFLVLFCGLAEAPAQDGRELAVPTQHVSLFGVSVASINFYAGAGWRLIDLDYAGTSGGTELFDAVFVRNTGSYAIGWWWYVGVTAAQVSSSITVNQARLIDLEPYQDAGGSLRFAAVMVDNTGANYKPWWWYYGTTTAYIGSQLSANNARLIDLDAYSLGGVNYYSAVAIRNTGADGRAWWWYVGVTAPQITGFQQTNQARLYDLERRSDGNWDCVMLRDLSPTYGYWWPSLTEAEKDYQLANHGARAYDVEGYGTGSARRYAVLAINNSNDLTAEVGIRMRSATSGQVGCWLEQINGPNLADLNGATVFEPASTMKTLHHAHTMRRVHLGSVSLSQTINVFTAYGGQGSSSCPVDSGPSSVSIQSVLQGMMENSDNARTQAITAYFGQASINTTATSLGLIGTTLNHRLGCPEGQTNPNRTTLRDLHLLHEAVANGYVGTYRNTFYGLMRESLGDLAIDALIDTEATALGLPGPTVVSFRSFTKMAHKGGNYFFTSPTVYHRAEFGWISLPFLGNGVLQPREYSFGAFVNDAPSDPGAAMAIYQHAIPELLRPTIRAALQTWLGSVAAVQTVGTGCGSPVYTQTASGPPHAGWPILYQAQNGHPNSLAILGFGFSDAVWSGVPLPASLVPFGGAAGCQAWNDIVSSHAFVANAAGVAGLSMQIPGSTTFVGLEYLTQFHSLGPASFKSSNSLRSLVGL